MKLLEHFDSDIYYIIISYNRIFKYNNMFNNSMFRTIFNIDYWFTIYCISI